MSLILTYVNKVFGQQSLETRCAIKGKIAKKDNKYINVKMSKMNDLEKYLTHYFFSMLSNSESQLRFYLRKHQPYLNNKKNNI